MLGLVIMIEGVILIVLWLFMVDVALMVCRVSILVLVLLLHVVVSVVVGGLGVLRVLVPVERVVLSGLLKDALKSHAVGLECVAGSLGLLAKHASCEDRCGEVHLFVSIFNVKKYIIIITNGPTYLY